MKYLNWWQILMDLLHQFNNLLDKRKFGSVIIII